MLILKCVANGVKLVYLSHYGHVTNDIYLNYNTLINEIDIKIKVTWHIKGTAVDLMCTYM